MMTGECSTYRRMLRQGEARLLDAGIEEAALDAWYLLEHVTGMDRARFFLDQHEKMPEEQTEEYRRLLEQRSQRIPLQHLTGTACFMGLDFRVNEHVLIPRQDTEKLVELVLEAKKKGKIAPDAKFLDMCTGSGCIAISLAVLGGWQVTAADVSAEALAVAGDNAASNGCGAGSSEGSVALVQTDMFRALEKERFDVIVSNPPYIPTAEIRELMPEVRDHDPMLALDGSEDGLLFYRILAAECPGHLNRGGRVFFEIGWDQGEAVKELLMTAGFSCVSVMPDDTGRDRVVTGEW